MIRRCATTVNYNRGRLASYDVGGESDNGDAADFLSLSPEEAAYVELRLSFSQNLRERRREKRLTQAQLARMIKSSQSRIAFAQHHQDLET